MAEENKNIWTRLETMDIRILYWILVILIAIPFLYPFGIPLQISEPVKDFEKTLNEIPPGSTILVDIGYGPNSYPILPGTPALVQYLIEQYSGESKMILLSGRDLGTITYEELFKPPFDDAGLEYGVDYVYFGYIPGLETYIARLAENIPTLLSVDYYGNEVNKLTIMNGINDYNDIDVVVVIDASQFGEWYAQHWASKGVKVVSMSVAVSYTKYNTLWTQGIISGLVGSARAAAEFEVLIGRPGDAVASTDTLSTSHVFLLILIVIGNIGYFSTRGTKEVKKWQ